MENIKTLHTNVQPYKLVNTAQEFEELFGNVPFEDIEKIKKYLLENYIPKSKIKEKIEECKNAGVTRTLNNENEVIEEYYFLQDEIDILQELMEDK